MKSHELSSDALQWVTDSIGSGSKILSTCILAGTTSSTLYKIDAKYKGRNAGFTLRLFTKEEWLKAEPDLALHEAESLRKAAEADVPIPEVIAYDEKGTHCGVPATLMTYLIGSIELKPIDFDDWIYQIAESLIRIHDVEVGKFPWSYFCWNDISDYKLPDWSRFPDLWRKAIEIVLESPPEERECFLHRDYHPTNILWQGNRISGIIDWVNACRGPAHVDISHCRTNLVYLYGVKATDQFLSAYQSLAGASFEYHPYWDLTSIVGFTLPGPPDVYSPWITFGIQHLNNKIMIERADDYLESVMSRF